MVTSSEAEQTLKTIRGLMERATIYRAISAPVALLAGALSLAHAGLFYYRPELIVGSGLYVCSWVVVLVLILGFNFFLLKKAALRRGDPVFSPGMKLAARGAVGPLSVAVVLSGVVIYRDDYPPFLVMFWVILYGLALLSTREFAPLSMIRLGYSFLFCGLVALTVYPFLENPVKSASLVMGSTFGLLHLIYAAATWPRQTNEPET